MLYREGSHQNRICSARQLVPEGKGGKTHFAGDDCSRIVPAKPWSWWTEMAGPGDSRQPPLYLAVPFPAPSGGFRWGKRGNDLGGDIPEARTSSGTLRCRFRSSPSRSGRRRALAKTEPPSPVLDQGGLPVQNHRCPAEHPTALPRANLTPVLQGAPAYAFRRGPEVQRLCRIPERHELRSWAESSLSAPGPLIPAFIIPQD